MNSSPAGHPVPSAPVDLEPAPLGRRRFLAGAGAAIGTAAVASATSVVPDGDVHAAVPSSASQFFILPTAVRLADTRTPRQGGYRTVNTANRIRVPVADRAGVPADATAVVLTVTAVNGGQRNHVTVFPSDRRLPNASNLNLMPGAVNANLVTVKVGDGSVDVQSPNRAHKVVDVLGYYRRAGGAVRSGRFVSLSTPWRAYDSRDVRAIVPSGSFTVVDVSRRVPASAGSVAINLTAAAPQGRGHFTAMPGGAPNTAPTTSSLNVAGPGDTRAAGVVVPVTHRGSSRTIKIYNHPAANVIVDVFGYYTNDDTPVESDEGLFVPLNPQRLIDTRDPGQIGRLWPNWVVEVPIPTSVRATAAAVVANVTGVDARRAGHVAVSAARRGIPATSNVNWRDQGAVVPNHVITRVTNPNGFQVYSSHGAHIVADLAGYFTGANRKVTLAPYVNPAPPGVAPDWIMRVPAIGLTSTIKAGADPYAVTNSGYSWHWTGTGYLGQEAHVGVFGHRTEYGGPYRYVHLLGPGHTLTVESPDPGDRRVFEYRYARRDLVWGANRNGPPVSSILGATRHHPAPSLSLIACTRTDWLPTSLNHRIIVTFELVRWYER